MNRYRKDLLNSYQNRLLDRQLKLKDLNELIPDYDNLQNSETAHGERRRLLRERRNLENDVNELEVLIDDLKTKNDDVTPVE